MTGETTTDATRSATGRSVLLFLLIGGAAIAAGLWFSVWTFGNLAKPPPPPLQEGTMLPQPRPLADFSLTDQDGHPFSLTDLRGHWTFLAIGYTSCPDICPMTLATFRAVKDRIKEAAAGEVGQASAQFLFISVDPGRDSPERLGQYVRYFDPEFLGVTGEEPQLRALVAQLGLLYARADGQETAMGYLMDHSASILLIDPQGRLATIFSAPHDPSGMGSDFMTIATDYDT